MSVAYLAAAMSALATTALQSPAVNSPGSGFASTVEDLRHAEHQDRFSIRYYGHDLEVQPESHPVRFRVEFTPLLTLAPVEYGQVEQRVINAKLTSHRKPKSGIRTYGAITNISENVQAIVDYYDDMSWRPVSMGGGGGLQYRVKFGAKHDGE